MSTRVWLVSSACGGKPHAYCTRVATPFATGSSGVTLSNISIAGYKTWSCANIADVRVDPPGSVSPDPSLYGCVGNASVVSPAYHASNFQ